MRIRRSLSASALFSVAALFAACPSAHAQKEFPPPQGNGRVVVVASGASGPEHYEKVSREISRFGYDVVLFDGNPMEGTQGRGLRVTIPQALAMPHALPGKVAVVGFSLGGGVALGYATQWPDQVAVVIVWYPATSPIKDIPSFASRLKVPVLMFAGESDNYKGCCVIGTARAIGAAAQAAGMPFELFTYPKTDHDFVDGGEHYKPESYKDALEKTGAKLKEALSN